MLIKSNTNKGVKWRQIIGRTSKKICSFDTIFMKRKRQLHSTENETYIKKKENDYRALHDEDLRIAIETEPPESKLNHSAFNSICDAFLVANINCGCEKLHYIPENFEEDLNFEGYESLMKSYLWVRQHRMLLSLVMEYYVNSFITYGNPESLYFLLRDVLHDSNFYLIENIITGLVLLEIPHSEALLRVFENVAATEKVVELLLKHLFHNALIRNLGLFKKFLDFSENYLTMKYVCEIINKYILNYFDDTELGRFIKTSVIEVRTDEEVKMIPKFLMDRFKKLVK